jgi:hypothetical protein
MTTIRQLITGAMRLNRLIATNETPTDDEMRVAQQSLTGLIDSLQTDLLNIYTTSPHTFLLTPGQGEYTLGPAVDSGELTGADWILPRPVRVERAVVVQNYLLPEPPAPPTGCNLVSSVQDADTTELWHFDEGIGATSTTATVWSGEEFSNVIDLSSGTFSLQNGCCDTGLYLGNDTTQTEVSLAAGAGGIGSTVSFPNGYTIEYSLHNDGSTSPSALDYAEVFRLDAFTYALGEGLAIIRGYKVGQDLYICKNNDVENPLVVIPLTVDTCTAIAIEADYQGYVSVYANGIRVFNELSTSIFSLYSGPENNANFIVFSFNGASKTGLVIDEFRRSNIIRYDAATYEYQL